MTLFTDPMGAWLWRATWQSAVLICLVLAVQWVFRRRLEPRWRHALWFVVMLRLVMPVSPSSDWSLFNWIQGKPVEVARQGSGTVFGNRRIAPANPVPTKVVIEPVDSSMAINRTEDAPKTPAVTMTASYVEPTWYSSRRNGSVPSWGVFAPISIWMLGVVAFAVHLAFVAGRIERKIRREQLTTDPGVLDLLKECQREMQISASIVVLETSQVQSPALYGFLQPRLLLPMGLAARFTRAELRFVFLHELAHVKRHDIALNWLAAALQAIHWFNPLVWFAFSRMRADRELACDALALRYLRGEERKPYGETILKLLDGFTARSPMPGLVGIMENGAEIKGRIRMIAAFKPATRWSFLALLLIGIIAMVGLSDAQPARVAAAATAPKDLGSIEVANPETIRHYPLSGGRNLRLTLIALIDNEVLITAVVTRTDAQGNTQILARLSRKARFRQMVSLPTGDETILLTPIRTQESSKAEKRPDLVGFIGESSGTPLNGAKLNVSDNQRVTALASPRESLSKGSERDSELTRLLIWQIDSAIVFGVI